MGLELSPGPGSKPDQLCFGAWFRCRYRPAGLPTVALYRFFTFSCDGRRLVHATLGIRPPAKKEGQGSDSQDRMDQTAMIAAKD
jgi:hypothetical protein